MGLVDIHDEVLQGITDIAHSKNVPVESLIGTAIKTYTKCWENEKISQQNQNVAKGRRYERQQTDWDDNFYFQFAEGTCENKIPGKLKDISINGLSFAFDDQHSVQEDLSVKKLIVSFQSPEDDKIIQFNMVPRHIRKEGEENIVGLAFADDDCDYHDFVTFLNLVEKQGKRAEQHRKMAARQQAQAQAKNINQRLGLAID